MLEVSEELKKAFMADNVEKQIRVTFPNGEHETITNEQIVANSVSFTESLCSKDTLKFGLCEANVFKCTAECEDIKGCEIEVFIDAYYNGEVYTVPYGGFTVESCKRQAGTKLRDIEAYSESITNNNSILPPFQNWKAQTPVSANVNSYEYGFNKLKYEFLKKGLDNPSEIIEPHISNSDVTFAWSYSSGGRYGFSYVITITFYRLFEYATTSANIIGDFRNKNRLYQSNIDIEQGKLKIIKELAEKYPFKQGRLIEPIIPAPTVSYDVNMDIITALHANFVIETAINGKKHISTYKMEKGQAYYPYLPNIAQGTNENTCRRSYLMLPYQMTVTYKNSIQPSSTESYYIGSSIIKDIVYQDVLEELPSFTIPLDEEYIDQWTGLTSYIISNNNTKNLGMYNIMNGYLELLGMFGKMGRDGNWLFFGINDNFARYPQENIFPSGDIFPLIGKNYLPLSTTSYKAADYEEFETHKYGYVRVTYLATDNEKYSITVECDNRYDNVYEMTDNALLLNRIFNEDYIKTLIINYFYPNIKDITYNPAIVNIKGLPFLEAGDVIKIKADEGNFKTFLFRRTIKGEQVLNENIISSGKERTDNAEEWINLVDNTVKE